MRKALMNLAWGLATAALAIATPLRAVAETTSVRTGQNGSITYVARAITPNAAGGILANSTTRVGSSTLAANAPSAFKSPAISVSDAEVGGGWDELICAGCVGVAAYTLFTGGAIMLPVLLTNPTAVGTLTGACIMACRSVLEEMME